MEPESTIPWREDTAVDVDCPCGQSKLRLWYNGGELDGTRCDACGRVAAGRHVETVIDIYPPGTTWADVRGN